MPREAAQILHEALELPPEQRAALADSLLNSLDADVDPDVEQAWQEEIERRIESVRNGTTKMVPWEEVQARLLSRLKR
ncbi:MAG TPA: addiction module protein [Acidobacteriaceae bacterium]|nr:addiction module protein [Acidobacteriaceae bacterium]